MGAFDMDLKRIVHQRDAGQCFRCGTGSEFWDVHHRLARKMGGANSRVVWINWVSNLLLLCRDCHNFIESNPLEARAAGWMISDHQDPEDVLVWAEWRGIWYRLHGPEFYKDPLTGLLAPFAPMPPPLWSEVMAA